MKRQLLIMTYRKGLCLPLRNEDQLKEKSLRNANARRVGLAGFSDKNLRKEVQNVKHNLVLTSFGKNSRRRAETPDLR